MAKYTGPPKGELKYMTPYKIAGDPPPSQPIPGSNRSDLRAPSVKKRNCKLSVVKVTGGAQGLGLVCARALLEHGLRRLAIFDIDMECGGRAIEHLRSLDDSYATSVEFRRVDVANEDSVNESVADMSGLFNGIDILVCFAGITDSKLAVEYPIDAWKKIFDVNLHGSFLVARAVAKSARFPSIIVGPFFSTDIACRDIMTRNASGSMVFCASMSGYVVNTPQPHSAYAISKAAVHHLTCSLAGEWVGHNIRVNSISPGIMNTRLAGGEAQQGLRKAWLEKSPMGIGDPEDLTGAVVLLCSDAGRFITGTDIKIDGNTLSGF
ncbi:MAG: hypothetical protein Q9217_000736 [Psora testacea]